VPTIATRPATPDTWDDVAAAMTGGGDGGSCWCQWWNLTSREWGQTKTPERRALLEAQVAAGPPPGVVAYVDGAAAGWARVAPRPAQARVARARIPKASPFPQHDPSVWAITCLQVRREHRGLGVTRALVGAALDLARAGGATAVEAYPVDTGGVRHAPNSLYHGTASLFVDAGFEEFARPQPNRPVMVLRFR
jgi:GNAT superfamily N-acetyltransferase